MVQVYDRLYVGDLPACRPVYANLAVVHACKSPCHQRYVGYAKSLPVHHPNYLFLAESHDLYLNLVDPPLPLFKLESFQRFLQFASERYDGGASLLIHCNQGESRSPSLALTFLAKHLKTIPNDSFAAAKEAFASLYARYRPGAGIQTFLDTHWETLASAPGKESV